MDNSGQVSQDNMAISRISRAFGVGTPVTPPRTGDEGGEAPFSEYSLHFKMTLVARGCPGGWGGLTLALGLSPLALPCLLCHVKPETWGNLGARNLGARHLVGPETWWSQKRGGADDILHASLTNLKLIQPDLYLQARSMDIRLTRIR